MIKEKRNKHWYFCIAQGVKNSSQKFVSKIRHKNSSPQGISICPDQSGFLSKLIDYLLLTSWIYSIFWKRLFPKIGPYFCRFVIKWTRVQTKEYFAGSIFWTEICKCVHQKWGHTMWAVYYKEKRCLFLYFNSNKSK